MQKGNPERPVLCYREVRCNRCGREIPLREGIPTEDFLSVDKVWGYASAQDGIRVRFDLCETSVDQLIGGFVLPPEREEQTEWV